MKKLYGLLPAAGHGMRMRPFRYPKELLPVYYESVNQDEYVRPKLLIEHSLNAFSLTGIQDIYVVVPEWKPEIMRYLEDGEQFYHHIAYLYNGKAAGLADALLSGYPWLKDKYTCFAMPDTLFSPANGFESLQQMMDEKNADLVLGVFPTNEPQHFAPVEFTSDQRVIGTEEKPASTAFNNTWGIALWSPAFWEFFKNENKDLEHGISVTQTFDKAAKSDLRVYCVYFEHGWYKDVGRIDNITIA
ncbi:NTP transferase domain-containing protein [Mucilaginibacter rubeus]|uniref:glucose-1-phosphate thymidylyltransferase n=1 Tax=Mucilaginibacter rubeus TaxID=2027860 RepID=A0AAE6JHU9_9SPHI|nr:MULTISPECIES: sugar phosphate nucleotidyltransferase [Mucilaginibacter]QEM05979.1 NTP transferase domain-containing protein [Mucilaginibacter rubeus]QEM18560.1 NTP transferase domain-containing protein [Mucilaginibacter gossypii]QTE44898.1 NTP transferase domain-containing protein [Mucilaginibacter rubeus]QTE51496.1 NTP transferase domain-containing protein [Mucilaginibacter rubeus]QTE56582.1 NTP transferase domain-containing protein [Mucilaginibacter rubeus]